MTDQPTGPNWSPEHKKAIQAEWEAWMNAPPIKPPHQKTDRRFQAACAALPACIAIERDELKAAMEAQQDPAKTLMGMLTGDNDGAMEKLVEAAIERSKKMPEAAARQALAFADALLEELDRERS